MSKEAPALPLYLLQPVPARLADPAWTVTSHRAHCMVAARSERAARERAALALMRQVSAAASPYIDDIRETRGWHASGPDILSPWLQPRLVEIAETPALAAAGLGASLDLESVLVPRDPGSPVAEYRVLGLPAPPPATLPESDGPLAAEPSKPARRRAAAKAKPARAARSAKPAPARKPAKAAAPARARSASARSTAARASSARASAARPAASGAATRAATAKKKRAAAGRTQASKSASATRSGRKLKVVRPVAKATKARTASRAGAAVKPRSKAAAPSRPRSRAPAAKRRTVPAARRGRR